MSIQVSYAPSAGPLTLTPNADGFSVAGGTTPRTLTVTAANVTLNQSLQTTNTPQFTQLGIGAAADATALLNLNGAMLTRDAANILAQRNGVNSQAFTIYGTYTNASNYERLAIGADIGASSYVYMQAIGTGVQRALTFQGATLGFRTGTTNRWSMDASGHFLAEASNQYDIGASAANKPRTGYFATSLITPLIGNGTTGIKVGSAASDKLSLWGVAVDIQPTNAIAAATFVANTSLIANDTATFGGYTIGQVVAALKRIGALA